MNASNVFKFPKMCLFLNKYNKNVFFFDVFLKCVYFQTHAIEVNGRYLYHCKQYDNIICFVS